MNFYDGSFYLGISGVVVIVSHLLIRPVSCSLDAAQRFYIGASLFFVLYLASGTVWSTVSSLLPVAATEIYPWRFIVVGWWLIGAYFLDQTFSDFENQPNLTASNAPTNRTHSEGNVSPERQVLSNHKISLLLTSLVVFANSADLRNFQLSKFPESW